jgi:hypothetical protein
MRPEQERICTLLEEGKSLRAAAKEIGFAASTVLLWEDNDPEFAERYARARLIGYKLLADEILEISDDGRNDTYTDDEGNKRTDQDVIARSRLRVDSRKWMLAKMLPKVYGDKLDLNHSGSIAVPREMTEADLERIASAGKP